MIEAGLAAARWLQFAAAMLLCGVPVFCIYAMAPGTRDSERAWLRGLLQGAISAAVIAAVLLLLFESAEMSGDLASAIDASTIWAVLSGTYFGAVWLARLALLVVITIIAFRAPRASGWLSILGLAAAASLAWQGHGGEGESALASAHRIADVVHLVAASIWIGALVVLVHLLNTASKGSSSAEAALYGLSRFSGIGGLVVATLIGSGVVNVWALTAPQSISVALTTTYALVLGVKLALFVGMLALAALNRFVLTARLQQSLNQPENIGSALVAVRRSVAVETALAVLVLIAVAVLGVMEPPSAV